MRTYRKVLGNYFNWKIINMIIDKLLEFEDKDLICSLDVCIQMHNTFVTVYTYRTGENVFDRNMTYHKKDLEFFIKTYGWRYAVVIENKPEGDEEAIPVRSAMDEFKSILENTGKLIFVPDKTTYMTDYWKYKFKEI